MLFENADRQDSIYLRPSNNIGLNVSTSGASQRDLEWGNNQLWPITRYREPITGSWKPTP